MLRWLEELTKGRAPKRAVLIYIDPDDLVIIDEAKDKHLVESRGQYVRNSLRHYHSILKAIYGEEWNQHKKHLRELKSKL